MSIKFCLSCILSSFSYLVWHRIFGVNVTLLTCSTFELLATQEVASAHEPKTALEALSLNGDLLRYVLR